MSDKKSIKQVRRFRPRNADAIAPIESLIAAFMPHAIRKGKDKDGERAKWRERFMACYRRGRIDQMNGHIPNVTREGDGE